MVLEFFEMGGVVLEGASDVLLIASDSSKAPIGRSAIAGGIVGFLSQNQNQTMLGSAAVGAIVPLLTMKQSSLSSVAICALSAVAGGMLVQQTKHNWHNSVTKKSMNEAKASAIHK